jgi:hypothetical protein
MPSSKMFDLRTLEQKRADEPNNPFYMTHSQLEDLAQYPTVRIPLPNGIVYEAVDPDGHTFYVGWTGRDIETRQREHLTKSRDLNYGWQPGRPMPFALLLHMLHLAGKTDLIKFIPVQDGTKEDECRILSERWRDGHPILNLGVPCHEFQDKCEHNCECHRTLIDKMGGQGTFIKGEAHIKRDSIPYITRWALLNERCMVISWQTSLEPMLDKTIILRPNEKKMVFTPDNNWEQWFSNTRWYNRNTWNDTRKVYWSDGRVNGRPMKTSSTSHLILKLYQEGVNHVGYSHVLIEAISKSTLLVCSFEDLEGTVYPPPDFPNDEDLNACLEWDAPREEIRRMSYEVPSKHLNSVLQQLAMEDPIKLKTIQKIGQGHWNIDGEGGIAMY